MSAKAAKKSKKGTTMTLQDFQSTWADEMDNEEDHFPTTRTATETTRPSSTRPSEGSWQRESTGFHSESRSERPSYSRDSGRREYEPRTREERPTVEIPTSPPYTAFIRNLSWEVRQEDLAELFQELSVTGIRMPEREGKPSGIAYVEFRDVESLKKALDLDGQEFAGRGMFVSVAEPRKDDRRRDNFSRESRGEFSRESRGEFSRESRGEFHRESRDNFSRESRGEFSRESRGEFSRESRGDFHREPREFTRESRGELAREEGRDRRGFSDREGRVSAPEQGSWERGAQLPQQERKPFRTERSEEQSGDSERPRRSFNKPDTERNFGEWRREGAEKATPTNNTTPTTSETERPKPKPKTGANPFGSAAPKNIDTDAFLQHRKDEKQKEEKKQEEKAEETKKASEPSKARRESTDKKEIAPSRSDAVDTWRRGEALEPKKEGKKVAGKEGSQPNKTQDKPKKDEQPKQTQDKPKKATTTTPTTTKKKDTTNANANVFSVLGDQ